MSTDAAIRALQPNVTPSEAVRLLSAGGIAAGLRRLLHGPLQRIADVYVPFWLYRVRYQMGRATKSRFFALDAVQGALDLFEFPEVPEAAHLVTIHTRNFLQPKLETAQAEKLLREKALRVIFLEGFFKLRHAHLEIVRQPIDLHLPYWLGFYGGHSHVGDRGDGRVRGRLRADAHTELYDREGGHGQVGNQGHVHCRVLDALRRRFEGPKASAFFASSLAA